MRLIAASILGRRTDQVDEAPAVHDVHVLPLFLPLLLGPICPCQLPRDPGAFLGSLARDPHLELGVVLAGALALPRGPIAVAAHVFLIGGVGWLLFGLREGRGRLAAQDGQAAGGVDILHALLGGMLLCGGGGLVALDAGDVVGIVDVPGLLAQEVAVGSGVGRCQSFGCRVRARLGRGGEEELTEAWLLTWPSSFAGFEGFALEGWGMTQWPNNSVDGSVG